MGFSRQQYWVGCHFFSSRGSSQPWDWTHISCVSRIAGWFLACWPIREAHRLHWVHEKKRSVMREVSSQTKGLGWATMAMMEGMRHVWSQGIFWISLLDCPSPILFNSSNAHLFVPQIGKPVPKGKGLVQGHTAGPRQGQTSLFCLASLSFSQSLLWGNSIVFHKLAIPSSWWHFKKTRRHLAESLHNIKRNQDFDVLQLEQRRCVENTKQMFGLRIQNNMYLTLQFKKLNSNMCLVGFPESIDSCSIKLNKHQLQLVVFPYPFFLLSVIQLFSNSLILQIRSFPHVRIRETMVILANTIIHSGHSLFPIALYTFSPLDLCLCCFCA